MKRIVTFGDSVTYGTRPGVEETETYSAVLERRLGMMGYDVEVLSRGTPSENTSGALARIDEITALQPDDVTIMYGLNDSALDPGEEQPRLALSTFRDNLTTIIYRLRAAGIRPVLLTPNPMDSFAITKELYGDKEPYLSNGINFMLENYVEAMRHVGALRHTPMIDIYATLREYAEREGNLQNYLTDGMHPNPAGHAIIANKLVDYFVRTWHP